MNKVSRIPKGQTKEFTGLTVIEGNIEDGATLIIKDGELLVKGTIGSNCIVKAENDIEARKHIGDSSTLTSTSGKIILSQDVGKVTLQAKTGITCEHVGKDSVLQSEGQIVTKSKDVIIKKSHRLVDNDEPGFFGTRTVTYRAPQPHVVHPAGVHTPHVVRVVHPGESQADPRKPSVRKY